MRQLLRQSLLREKSSVGLGSRSALLLLGMIAKVYGKSTAITPDDGVAIDRSLNVERFTSATDYRTPEWLELIETMRVSR